MSDENAIAVQEALARSNETLAEAINGLTLNLTENNSQLTVDQVEEMFQGMVAQVTSGVMLQLEAKYKPHHEVEGEILVGPSDVKGVRLCR